MRVLRFVEKPDAATALDLMASGALWNSGLFAWTATVLMDEVRRHTDEIVMVAGTPPIRAKKARYFEDRRFQERVLPPPRPAQS